MVKTHNVENLYITYYSINMDQGKSFRIIIMMTWPDMCLRVNGRRPNLLME